MNKAIKASFLGLVLLMQASELHSQQSSDSIRRPSYLPEIHGTLRTKYEYSPPIDKCRFEVRNARLSIEGSILPSLKYKAEADLCDEGSMRILNANLSFRPNNRFKLTFGGMRVPFGIDVHRSPHEQYFANRSFLAKQAGNVRDVGAVGSYTFFDSSPLTVECGIFNGSGLTGQKDFWTDDCNFSFKASGVIARQFNIALGCMKANAGDMKTMLYDAAAYWENGKLHIEAEYLRKHYAHSAFKPVDVVNVFALYRFLPKKNLPSVSLLCRYDYMSDHTDGSKDEEGVLRVSDSERHRLTAGLTLHFGKDKLQADLRLNYEHYFYTKATTPAVSEQDKLVLELVAHF